MSTFFTKTFSREPDLVLELEGIKEDLEGNLLAQGFRIEQGEGDDTQAKDTKAATRVHGDDPGEKESEVATREALKKSNIRILMHVSAKHLTDAGDFFHVQKKWREHLNQTHRPLKFSEPDVCSFGLLMNMFHTVTDHLNYQYVNFDALFRFCKMVDLYDTPRALSPWAYIWYNRCHQQAPTGPSKDAQQWLFIMHLLKRGSDFRNLALVIHRQYTKADLDQLVEAPPASRIQDMIVENRLVALKTCVESLKALLQSYQDTGPRGSVCQSYWGSCDAFTLGGFVTDLGNVKLWPLTIEFFERSSLHTIHTRLTSIEEKRYPEHPHAYRPGKDCGLHDKVAAIAAALWNTRGITMPI